jgi:hypothetical protein
MLKASSYNPREGVSQSFGWTAWFRLNPRLNCRYPGEVVDGFAVGRERIPWLSFRKASTMHFQFCLVFKRRGFAMALLFASLAAASLANAASSPSRNAAIAHPSPPAIDDQEDDVTAFFTSGAYTKRLGMPLIAVGCLLGFLAAAAFASKLRSSDGSRPTSRARGK